MKAIIQEIYGPPSVLYVDEVAKPEPKSDEVLVHIRATSLNAPDWRLLSGTPFLIRLSSGLIKPKHRIKGTDMAGTVAAVGSQVKNFKVGDEVYGDLADAGFGAFADYVCVKESILGLKPTNLGFLEAAALPLTSVTALQAIRDLGHVTRGHHVLIIGASGGVGSYALQLAKNYSAHVTAVVSTKHQQQATELGADAVVDYTKTDLASLKERFDVIIAINGYYSISTYRELLKPQGRFVMVGGSSIKQMIQISAFGPIMSKKGGKTFVGLLAKPSAKDLNFIKTLVEEERLVPVIQHLVRFEEIPKWLAKLQEGHICGKIVAWVNR